MSVAFNQPLRMAQPVSPPFARKSGLAKVGQGWGETLTELPGAAIDKLQRTAQAIAHPVATLQQQVAEWRANPARKLAPLAMMAGGVALGAISPGLMRLVGVGLAASTVVFPTVRFARAGSEDELEAIADGTARQLVDTAAGYATSWAAGQVIRHAIQRVRAAQPVVRESQVERGLNGGAPSERVTRGAQVKPTEWRVAGNTPEQMRQVRAAVDPDNINFDAVRADREMWHRFVTDVRGKVRDFHFTRLAKAKPGLTRDAFEAFLKTPDAHPLRLQMVQDVRGIVHANYLGAHGIQVTASMPVAEMAGTRRYLQTFGSHYDLADAVRGINTGLAKGLTGAAPLTLEAERMLYAERGVAAPFFQRFERQGLAAKELQSLRGFTDRFATGQSGRYLKVAAQAASGQDVALLRDRVTRQLLMDAGVVLPKGEVDSRLLVSLLRDMTSEDPRNLKTLVKTVNEALRAGQTNYYDLDATVNRRILRELGVSPKTLAALDVPDAALKTAQPRYPEALTRAEQTRLLRDRLRVLPDAQRQEAVASLSARGATLLDFDQHLTKTLETQVSQLAGASRPLVGELTRGMTMQQKANFVADLARLPEPLRREAFAGLTGLPAEQHRTVVGRLAKAITQRFGVTVHREAGHYPASQTWARGRDPLVKDWSAQGVSQLYNALHRMAGNGELPPGLAGTTYVNMGAPSAPVGQAASVTRAGSKAIMYYKPGSSAYQGGTMGYRTADSGSKDLIVLFDDAMRMHNADEAVGVSMAEGTLIHESGHAIQLGGRSGMTAAAATAHEKKLMAEWSALSNWREQDGSLADGYARVGGLERRYYKDPGVQVGQRARIVSDYGATDPVEDFAEFTRTFYNDPASAMAVSAEKFLYLNELMGQRYAPGEVNALASALGLGAQGLQTALLALRGRLKAA
ncbi:MAG: hypothetical protein VKP62_05330 [Candidatus Sericytochromatia bacterium]|nr:hypothetical protein [Candidatus Sericytochromatia bacterium]